MKLVDEVEVRVFAGDGGAGACAFRREKFIPMGGPSGGDGGRGGHIYVEASHNLNTLLEYRYTRRFCAERGQSGSNKDRYGRSGKDIILKVPHGTIITDLDSDSVLLDTAHHPTRFLLARGGDGGLGNIHFKSSVNRTPRRCTAGYPGQSLRLRLELRVLADVGLLGLPNVGKSTFIRAVSAARPKVANYPFTTLSPHLGVVDLGAGCDFVIADIPGLVPGAAGGVGLGVRFLKHLQRTRLLLHILSIDLQAEDGLLAGDESDAILAELKAFDPALYERPRWLVINKLDLLDEEQRHRLYAVVKQRFGEAHPVFFISAVTGEGCHQLVNALGQAIQSSS